MGPRVKPAGDKFWVAGCGLQGLWDTSHTLRYQV
jgi:hypothetical protein